MITSHVFAVVNWDSKTDENFLGKVCEKTFLKHRYVVVLVDQSRYYQFTRMMSEKGRRSAVDLMGVW